MYTWSADPIDGAKSQLGYVETDPSHRYGRFREVLGKGAMKTVYKAFDEVLGMEVAWNQVKLNLLLQSPDGLQRLYSEVHLLMNLNHESIIKFYAYWIDVERNTFNFITEMLASGTLREYRQRYKVKNWAIKSWTRQILSGLAYLHGLDPPVIHRDLKCHNIFVNGHLGQVKIGDFGLAAILNGSHHAHSVIGTPEFMAPELYEEEYDELVDVYSLGMCVLEMLTSEYPYTECSNPAQIYKKVTSGKLPEAINRIEDVEARNFVKKCLQNVAKRPSAQQLLADPFLAAHEETAPPTLSNKSCSISTGELLDLPVLMKQKLKNTDMTITGTIDPINDTIFLKVKIAHKNGESRNVYFPFEIMSDTAVDVASEMVKELEITDWEPLEIAAMIDEEISALIPSWKHDNLIESQYSFNYNDDDDYDGNDNRTHHPFYSQSSHSSSQASLPGLYISPLCDWFQESLLINDKDASSQASPNSHNYSNLNFCSGSEKDMELSPRSREGCANFIENNHSPTRFCPKQGKSKDRNSRKNERSHGSNGCPKLGRVKSLLDIRSQLVHRTSMEKKNKLRLFKTVGSYENIGYKQF